MGPGKHWALFDVLYLFARGTRNQLINIIYWHHALSLATSIATGGWPGIPQTNARGNRLGAAAAPARPPRQAAGQFTQYAE